MKTERGRVCRILGAFLVVLIIAIAGCGKSDNGSAFNGPVTVEQAATVLDLSTFPLVEGAKPPWPRGVASLSYEAPATVKNAFAFIRKELLARGWKELPNSAVTDQAASATFAKSGFTVSTSVFPHDPNMVAIQILNLGNLKPGKLPLPPNTKPVYVGDAAAMFVTDAPVAETKDACRKLLLADGWSLYGGAGDSSDYKKNAIRVEATVSSAPAQGGKTMISYSTFLMSADLPAPPDVTDLRYVEQTQELEFQTAADRKAVADFYKKTLGDKKWSPTTDRLIQIDGRNGTNDEMIFRNPAQEMLTLSMPHGGDGPVSVSLQYLTAAEVAELSRDAQKSK